jgi:hypothetical protein
MPDSFTHQQESAGTQRSETKLPCVLCPIKMYCGTEFTLFHYFNLSNTRLFYSSTIKEVAKPLELKTLNIRKIKMCLLFTSMNTITLFIVKVIGSKKKC